jgi:hypothetical protein
MSKASAVIVVLLALLAVQGTEAAGDSAGPIQDGPGGPQVVVEHDDLFAEVAALAPGFGGLFLDKDGILNVYLLDPAAEGAKTAAIDAIAAVFGPDRFPLAEVRTLQGTYSFSQLHEWRKDLRRDVLGLRGVTTLDIHDFTFRLMIGVEATEVETRVEEELARLAIPREAVDLWVEPPVEPILTLRQYYRPIRGGFQVTFNPGYTCTLGFNAVDSSNRSLLVTASHCSSVQGEFDNDLVYQPTVDAQHNNLIGAEFSDPPFWTGAPCPDQRRCRWSDSLLAVKSAAVSADKGGVARTTGLGSITVDGTYPRFRITAENQRPSSGETLNKMGKSTGWTQGPVDLVCVDVDVVGDRTLLCQDRVAANVSEGDSGAPVFRITNSPAQRDVKLYGLVWAKEGNAFWFSAMYNVQLDLGQLKTCATGFTC